MTNSPHRRWPRVAVGLLALACLAAIWFLRDFGRDKPPAPDAATRELLAKLDSPRLRPAPIQIADGIYMLGDLNPAAVYVVETRDGLAMIDSGLEAEYDKLTQGLAGLGLQLSRLKMILLTHAHGDHTMGAERLRRETGAKIHIGREDALPLREGGPWEAIFSKFDMPGVTLHPTTIDLELTDGQVLKLGEATFTCIATPGHTSGSFCYLLERGGTRALFTGDTVMSLSDGLGTYSTYLPPKYRGNADEYLKSLRKLKELPTPDLVLPGHPNSDTVPQDPRLGENRWEALLDRGITELELLSERYARDGADFLDGAPKQLDEGLFYLGNQRETAVYALVSSGAAFLFDAASGDDPSDFLAAAWKELHVEPPPVAALLLTSCRDENLAGLEKLVDDTGCAVVASPAGIDAVSARGSEWVPVSTDELATLGQPELKALVMPGRDDTAVVYRFQLGEITVVVSGNLLVESETFAPPKVASALSKETWDTEKFAKSLAALESAWPNLWLSAQPWHGRNANLYDFEWEDVLALNRELVRRCRRMKTPYEVFDEKK